MENKRQITMQIVDLFHELRKEIFRVTGTEQIAEYAKMLAPEKNKTLNDIRDFRNQVAFSTKQPVILSNYQEWIDFLKDEIKSLKNDCK